MAERSTLHLVGVRSRSSSRIGPKLALAATSTFRPRTIIITEFLSDYGTVDSEAEEIEVEIEDGVSSDDDNDGAEMIDESDSTETDCNDTHPKSIVSSGHSRVDEDSSTPSPALATSTPAPEPRIDRLLRLYGLIAANGNQFNDLSLMSFGGMRSRGMLSLMSRSWTRRRSEWVRRGSSAQAMRWTGLGRKKPNGRAIQVSRRTVGRAPAADTDRRVSQVKYGDSFELARTPY